MATDSVLHCPEGWEEQRKPRSWNRRFSFADYAATRAFLDQLAALSEEFAYYPNLNFARTYVVVSMQFPDDEIDPQMARYAHGVQQAYSAGS
ncbi:hypothetical protein [Acidithiobacillus sp. AMEEHan]|uniref:hypothetical protein n=1 Tax=Acidithiobacillus sp. AMEEHan TaxID=2994951 RepID=UPI0027E5058B|nr:hypothetical protein [Acidithiobacillus sp. AMEEHan]